MFMSVKPVVSILTCFYNEARFLDEAIQSVLNQEFQDWELLLIDDGSTDNSTTIAKRYAAEYPEKIIYKDHPGHINKGLSASRNCALKIASGEFIALLDADDMWFPNYLTHQFEIMRRYDVAMICEASEYWYNWEYPEMINSVIPIGTKEDRVCTPPELMIDLYPLGKGAAPCPCAIIMNKFKLKKHGGFNEAFSVYEDQAFLSKFYLNENIYISSSCHNRYRQREGSIVSNSFLNGKYHDERSRFLKFLKQYVKTHQIESLTISRLINRALFPYNHPFLFSILDAVSSNTKKLYMKILSKIVMI